MKVNDPRITSKIVLNNLNNIVNQYNKDEYLELLENFGFYSWIKKNYPKVLVKEWLENLTIIELTKFNLELNKINVILVNRN